MVPSRHQPQPDQLDLADGYVFPELNGPQSRGDECVVCRAPLVSVEGEPVPEAVVVGTSGSTGRRVRACRLRCAPLVGYVAPVGVQQSLL